MKTKQPPENKDKVMLSVWVPKSVITELDTAARKQDTDRSKLVRRAIRATLRPA